MVLQPGSSATRRIVTIVTDLLQHTEHSDYNGNWQYKQATYNPYLVVTDQVAIYKIDKHDIIDVLYCVKIS